MTSAAKHRKRRGLMVGVAAMVVLVLVAAGFVVAPRALTAFGWWSDGGAPTIAADVFTPPPTPQAPEGVGVVGAATGATAKGSAQGAVLQQQIGAVKADGIGQAAWTVTDQAGSALAQGSATTLLMPASTMKVLTGLVALDSLPREHTFATTVTQPKPGQIVLVGGGDPMLRTQPTTTGYPRPASLAELAANTAKALKAKDELSVTLGFDARLFSGADWEPSWEAVFETDVTRISALITDTGINPTTKARTKTPAADAATAFATLLREQGIQVAGTIAPAEGSGTEVARVSSLPLRVLVQQALLTSDNTATEMLLRQAAIASGQSGTFAGGAEALRKHLVKLGIWQDGAVIVDGSGVSRNNRVSPAMLAGAIKAALADPRYAVLTDALPVAGGTGTLRNRFTDEGTAGGRGWVRAKTGSLRDVSALAGFTRTTDGQLLVLVFITNGFTNGANAKAWIDQSAAVVAGCGCR